MAAAAPAAREISSFRLRSSADRSLSETVLRVLGGEEGGEGAARPAARAIGRAADASPPRWRGGRRRPDPTAAPPSFAAAAASPPRAPPLLPMRRAVLAAVVVMVKEERVRPWRSRRTPRVRVCACLCAPVPTTKYSCCGPLCVVCHVLCRGATDRRETRPAMRVFITVLRGAFKPTGFDVSVRSK